MRYSTATGLRWGAVTTILMVLAGGCTADTRKSAVVEQARDLYAAVSTGKWSAACDVLAPETVRALERDSTCAEALAGLDLPDDVGGPSDAQIWGRSAQIHLGREVVFLAEFADGWRITAAGCTPVTDRPYQCVIGS